MRGGCLPWRTKRSWPSAKYAACAAVGCAWGRARPSAFICCRRCLSASAAHPGVQLQLEIAASDVLARRLAEGAIDIAYTEAAIADANLLSTVFMEDQLVAIAPAKHPLARKRRVTARMLCEEPLVVRETGSGTQSLVERALADGD